MMKIVTLIAGMVVGAQAMAGLMKNQVLVVEGLQRTYDVYVPDRLDDHPHPLVLLLHGHMGDADVMTGENGKAAPYKVWLDIAKREQLIIVIPDGAKGPDGYRGWNDCRADAQTNPSADDMMFLDHLIDTIAGRYAVDRKRLYAHGTSNGGNMVYRLAQERSGRFAALAAVVAAMPKQNRCGEPRYPVSLLIMNGTDDPILPYQGGGVGRRKRDKEARGTALSAQETLQYWLKHNGINSKPVIVDLPDTSKRDGSSIEVRRYSGGKAGSEVVLYEVRGGGHTEPSLSQHYGRLYGFIVGKQNKDMEMAEEVWKFFRQHRLPDSQETAEGQ